MGRPNPRDEAATTFQLDLEGGRHPEISLSRTRRGSFVHAEERIDGRVVGVIDASQQILQVVMGLAQRASRPENRVAMGRPSTRSAPIGAARCAPHEGLPVQFFARIGGGIDSAASASFH